MRTSTILILLLSFLTGTGILFVWILTWSGLFPVVESVPGFRNYFISFVVADSWLILTAFMTVALTLRKNPRAVFFGVALGSAMLFFGLYALMYDLNTGLLWRFTVDEIFGKVVTLYNIFGGIVLMFLSWRNHEAYLSAVVPPADKTQ